MQREITTTAGDGGAYNDNTPSSPPSFLSQPNEFNLTSLYSSILFPQNQNSQSLIDQHYYEDLMDRHNRVLSQLLEAEKKTLALRQENINLKMANFNLNNQLSLLLKASASDYGPGFGLDSVVDGIRRMRIGVGEEETSSDGHSWEDLVADRHLSPTSVMDSGRSEGVDRVLLPKSISVRSNGYLKTVHAAGGSRPQIRTKSVHTAQKVYVKGGNKKEEQPLELEVYNQGMFKTELCNKWQETGACPYGNSCQFAHGIEELRPILRHPRYKTEVCRMVLNGDPCPYGHRCHFRHTLTDQEKLMRSLNTRS